jgi:hypothetical protein
MGELVSRLRKRCPEVVPQRANALNPVRVILEAQETRHDPARERAQLRREPFEQESLALDYKVYIDETSFPLRQVELDHARASGRDSILCQLARPLRCCRRA